MSGIASATVVALSSLGGAYMQSEAAEDAASIQAGAANRAADIQHQQFLMQQALMSPFVRSGQAANALLQYRALGLAPTQYSMQLDPNSIDYINYIQRNPQFAGKTLYSNPFTGEIGESAPDISQYLSSQSSLDPSRWTMDDFRNSLDYRVYSGARDAASKQSISELQARMAAQGMGGLTSSGNVMNALTQNLGQTYAQYDPAALASWKAGKTGEYNMLAGMANPAAAQQVANYAGQYGANAGNAIMQGGNALAQGQIGRADAWAGGLSGAVNTGLSGLNAFNQNQMWRDYQSRLPGPGGVGTMGEFNAASNQAGFVPTGAVPRIGS